MLTLSLTISNAAISLLLFQLKASTKPRSHACLYLLLISPGRCRGVSILPSGMCSEGDSPQLGSCFLRSSDVIKRWNDFDVSGRTERYREIQRDGDTVQTAAWFYGTQTGGAGDARSISCPRDLAIKVKITVCVCCLLLGWYCMVRIMRLLSRCLTNLMKKTGVFRAHLIFYPNWFKLYTWKATIRKYAYKYHDVRYYLSQEYIVLYL